MPGVSFSENRLLKDYFGSLFLLPFCRVQDAACLFNGNEPLGEKGIILAGARPAKEPNASATSLKAPRP